MKKNIKTDINKKRGKLDFYLAKSNMKKVVKFKSQNKKENRKINRKKIIITFTISIAILLLAIAAIIYNTNENFRIFADKYILMKNVTEADVPIIDIDYESNTNIIPYGKYICILAENTLFEYNSSGKKEKEVKIEISNPIYDVENNYLVIGEKDNQKLYLINGEHIVWEKNIEGNLSKVTVNKNGYVSAIVTGTTHKSVIIIYGNDGNELFKSYLSNTIAVDACISPNNSELAYAEVNTSGTTVQSNIKIISVSEAKEKNAEPKYTYKSPQNSLILRIKYQDKKLVCMYENSIHTLEQENDVEIMKLNEENKKISFADIELNNYIFRAEEKSTGIFSADTVIEIKNINNQKENIYTTRNVAKSITSGKNIIAINLGTEVEFIDTNGWLVKKYISTQVIRDIVICDGLAGVIYRDKIELISL